MTMTTTVSGLLDTTQQWSTLLRTLVTTNSHPFPFRILTVSTLNFLRYLSPHLTEDQAGYATDRNLLSYSIKIIVDCFQQNSFNVL